MADDIAVGLLLTRDGVDVTGEVVGGRIFDAPAGDYVATWTASSGDLTAVTTSDSLTIIADAPVPNPFAVNQWSLATGANPGEIIINISVLPANNGSPIRAIEYQIDDGDWELLAGVSTGPRTIQMSGVSTAYGVVLRAINSAGASDPSLPKTVTSGAPAQQAPAVQTPPQITGNTTVGSILNRNAGTATGIPTPQRSTVWLRNGTAITGQTANSLDTTGFAAGDVITTRDIWSNGIGSPATGTSDPWTLTVQPSLTATPPALTAGQQASITFNTAPDTVSITQGGTALTATRVGNTNEWTFTPQTTQPVSISATKAGHSPYSVVIENVQAAPPALVVTAQREAELRNVDENTPPFEWTINAPSRYAGTYTITPSQLAGGPVALVAPVITGNGQVGQVLTIDPGFWLTLTQTMSLAWTWPDGSTGLTYTVRAQDAGTTVTIDGDAADGNGSRPMTANGIAVTAPGAAKDTFSVPDGTQLRYYVGESGIGWEDKAGAEINGGKLRSATGSSVVIKRLDPPNPLQPVKALLDLRYNGLTGTWPACRINEDSTSLIYLEPFSGALRLTRRIGAASTGLGAWSTPFAVPMTVQCDIIPDPDGTTLRVYFDGVLGITATNVGLTTGSIGIIAFGSRSDPATNNGLLDFHGA